MFKGLFFLLKFVWKNQKSYLFLKTVSQILSAALPLLDTILSKYIFDEIAYQKRPNVLFGMIGILLAVNVIGYCLIRFLNGKAHITVCRLFTTFRTMLADQLSRCDFERLEDPHFLDIKTKAEKFLYANGNGFCGVIDNVFNIFGKTLSFIGISAIISTLNPLIAIAFVCLILINSYFESKVRKRSVQWDMEKTPVERRSAYFLDLVENFAFGKEVRMYGLRNWIVGKTHQTLLESEKFYVKQTKLSNRIGYLSTVMDNITRGVTYIYLAVKVVVSSISIGDFSMYSSALMSFSHIITDLMQSLLNIRQYNGYYDALVEYMNVPQKMYEGKNAPVPQGPYTIKFENVSFKYAGQSNYALKNVSLTLESGEKLSVVGENGAGKTTFVKLLCRLYDPTEGRITLNGTDIRDIRYDEYMSIMCSVFQDYKLLAFSIKENVSFMNSEAEDDDTVNTLLSKTGLRHKIDTLPKGIHTNIFRIFSDDGFEPSGGEGQRIALARAMYKDAPIMILDEPTAALDPRAEYEIYKNFSDMTAGKTAVFISHRLSSSKFCDRVALFSKGELAEYGTHDQLIAQNGAYKELFDMQAQFYV